MMKKAMDDGSHSYLRIPAAAMRAKVAFHPIKWYLTTKLDIPDGLDVRKKADIIIQ